MRFVRLKLLLLLVALAVSCVSTMAQEPTGDEEFGPVVRAYLNYLRTEQEVVDDRASRHEVSRAYYIRNSNRIRALRQMALKIATETGNDYLPEMEAAAADELRTIFDRPPKTKTLRVGEVVGRSHRFLGTVRETDLFYVFSRLDPYELQELSQKENVVGRPKPTAESKTIQATSRPRRVGNPN